MSLSFLILFYSTSLAFFLIAYFLYSRYKNKSTAKTIEKFDELILRYNPYFQKDIKIDFMTDNLGKYIIYPYGKANIYLFEKSIVLIRSHHFIFKIYHPPLILAINNLEPEIDLRIYENHITESIKINKVFRNRIDILLRDKRYNRYIYKICLKELNEETLEKINALINQNS